MPTEPFFFPLIGNKRQHIIVGYRINEKSLAFHSLCGTIKVKGKDFPLATQRENYIALLPEVNPEMEVNSCSMCLHEYRIGKENL